MKIAIYGGAFNPVHIGHIELVKQLNKNFCFDKILIIPSKFSPHKSNENLISEKHRLNMCKLSFASINNCEISDIEINRDEISYTVDTLQELKKIYTNDELFIICGSDMFLSLLTWRNPEEIFKLASIIGFKRAGESEEKMLEFQNKLALKGAKSSICIVDIPPFSSTIVRDAVKNKKNFQQYVTDEVYNYIKTHNLYL